MSVFLSRRDLGPRIEAAMKSFDSETISVEVAEWFLHLPLGGRGFVDGLSR